MYEKREREKKDGRVRETAKLKQIKQHILNSSELD